MLFACVYGVMIMRLAPLFKLRETFC